MVAHLNKKVVHANDEESAQKKKREIFTVDRTLGRTRQRYQENFPNFSFLFILNKNQFLLDMTDNKV
jgi:hypothetical protein